MIRRRCSEVRVSVTARKLRYPLLALTAGRPLDRQRPPRRVPCRPMPGAKYGSRAKSAANPADLASRRPVAVDLFAGAGGLSLGFEQAGFDVLASVEYDPIHTVVHAFNFPRTEVVCSDITEVTPERIRDAVRSGWSAHGHDGSWDEELDVLIGGPPCQGFSVIGKRSFEDARNQHVFSFARLVEELRPRYFVIENVPGMATLPSSPENDAPPLLNELLKRLRDAGYEVPRPQVLNASEWGVPQERKRLIVLGTRSGEEPAVYPSPRETQPLGKKPRMTLEEDPTQSCPTVWEAIGDLPDLDDFGALSTWDEVLLDDEAVTALEEAASPYVRLLRGLDNDPRDHAWPRKWDRELLTSSYRTVHAEGVVERFAATPQGRSEAVSRLFRLDAEGACCTLRAGTHYERGSFNAPRPIHPTRPRVISVREAARLHSFPDWFRFNWTKWHGFRQVGNALPPKLARVIGEQIIKALALAPSRPTEELELGDRSLLYLVNDDAAERFGADRDRMPRNALRTRRRPPPTEEIGEAAA